MSCTLYWKLPSKGKPVGDSQLRDAIFEEFGLPAVLRREELPFLRGLKVCGVDGAGRLIAEIEKHGEIEVWKEC